jgi:outer membrane lipopolysaccharide assembly protein LptE/RlpB
MTRRLLLPFRSDSDYGSAAPHRSADRLVTTLVATMLLLTLVLLGACGYTTRSMVSEDYKTIAVPIFENTTRRHDLEFEVTRAVVEELNARTHLVVVSDASSADLVLSGRLVDVDEDTLSRRNHQRPRQAVVFVSAEIEVKNVGTGESVVTPRRVTEREAYTYLVQQDLRTSREEAVRSLAERVVRQLEEGW